MKTWEGGLRKRGGSKASKPGGIQEGGSYGDKGAAGAECTREDRMGHVGDVSDLGLDGEEGLESCGLGGAWEGGNVDSGGEMRPQLWGVECKVE